MFKVFRVVVEGGKVGIIALSREIVQKGDMVALLTDGSYCLGSHADGIDIVEMVEVIESMEMRLSTIIKENCDELPTE